MWLYSLTLCVVLMVAAPYWLLRMATHGKYRAGLAERLGRVPARVTESLRGRRTIWVHAVSVGEVIAISSVVQMLQHAHPELVVVVSTTTRTGQRLARQRFGENRVFYFPLDFAWIIRRYLRALQPKILALAETELWPRMLWETHRAGVEIVVMNGRISDRSYPRYRALRGLWQPLWSKLTHVLAQSEQDAERFRAMGVPAGAIEVAGNLKYDVHAAPDAEISRQLRAAMPADAAVLVAGSTLEGEEKLLCEVFARERERTPGLILILAPRHPERFPHVAALLQQSGLRWVRRSQWMENPQPLAPGSVFLLDSIGELASVYSLARIAFVGGSLVRAGGHNPLEPAQFGVPILMGPHAENFRGILAALIAEEAIAVAAPEKFEDILQYLLSSPLTAEMGQRARRVFEQQAGASQRTLVVLEKILRAQANPGVTAQGADKR